jgi:hypothetical protein
MNENNPQYRAAIEASLKTANEEENARRREENARRREENARRREEEEKAKFQSAKKASLQSVNQERRRRKENARRREEENAQLQKAIKASLQSVNQERSKTRKKSQSAGPSLLSNIRERRQQARNMSLVKEKENTDEIQKRRRQIQIEPDQEIKNILLISLNEDDMIKRQKLREVLRSKGLAMIDVQADGNCQFYSIAENLLNLFSNKDLKDFLNSKIILTNLRLNSNSNTLLKSDTKLTQINLSKILRNMAANYIRSAKNTNTLILNEDKYIDFSKDKEWGTISTLYALSNILNVNFQLINEEGIESFIPIDKKNHVILITLGYINDRHYTGTLRITNS